MTMQQGTQLYKYGSYEARLGDNEYEVVNMETGVVEHTTRYLHEAIKATRIFHEQVEQAKAFEVKADWGKAPKQLSIEFDPSSSIN